MTLDTNIIIAYLGGDREVIDTVSLWRKQGRPLFLSTVVETEVLSFPYFAPSELQQTEEFLEANFTAIPFDRKLARIAAEIRR
jgi:predicted nucleic acid-binding protein